MSDEIKEPEENAKEEAAVENAGESKAEVSAAAEAAVASDTEASSENADAAKTEKPKAAPQAAKKKAASEKKGNEKLHTGRRKKSISRVKITKGQGSITVNKKPVEQFFSKSSDVNKVIQPLKLLGIEKEYDVLATVKGGGTTGQAEAIRMGLARSLKEFNEEFHKKLREAGYLTRDSRMVERKKYGLHKARRATQFSKR